jgi:hypothetical protein
MERANPRAAEAILAFAQSEKIKSGLISITQALEVLQALSPEERMGAEKVVRLFLGMTMQELVLARALASEDCDWDELASLLERALVMADSGVAGEAAVLLARAVSLVTTVGQRAMVFLKEEGLL